MTDTSTTLQVRIGRSERPDAAGAAEEIAAAIRQPGPALTLLFASPACDVGPLVRALVAALPEHELVGCTTAGEISPAGFHSGSAVAMSLAGPLGWASQRVDRISAFTHLDGKLAVSKVHAAMKIDEDDLDAGTCAMLLVDGLRGREEMITASLGAAAPRLRAFGASASDDFQLQKTYVFHQGEIHEDAALLVLLRPEVPFQLLKLEHFRPSGQKVVVTGADPEQRLVTELSGKPALEVYAELVGESAEALSESGRFMRPFAHMIRGEPYLRSVMRAEGEALRFACAVEEGVILSLMEAGDLVGSTAEGLERARQQVGGEVGAMLAFECLGRFFEARHRGLVDDLARAFEGWPVVGFHTYGEQYGSVHVNNTLTGLVLGRSA